MMFILFLKNLDRHDKLQDKFLMESEVFLFSIRLLKKNGFIYFMDINIYGY